MRTYAEYGQLVEAFLAGDYQLLFVVGRPGLGKSCEFDQRSGATSHLIRGWAAPLQCYIEIYRHRNKRLIFDDAEVLWKRPGGRILLRSLTEHRTRKVVQWTSTTNELIREDVPQRFVTSSKVAIIANQFAFGGDDEQEAILDRGHLIFFDPTPLEIHRRAADFFWDSEIYNYIGDRLHLLDNISFRCYLKACERKNAGGDWRRLIDGRFCHKANTLVVQSLEVDPQCKTVDDRVRKFIEQTGCCRATYFNLKADLRDNDQLRPLEELSVPHRTLRNSPPIDEEFDPVDDEADAKADSPEDTSGDRLGAQQVGHRSSDYSDDDDVDAEEDPADWWKNAHKDGPVEQDKPGNLEEQDCGRDACSWLRRAMKEAIEREDYERAAELRDEIQTFENRGGEDGA